MTAPWQPGMRITPTRLDDPPLVGQAVAHLRRVTAQNITSNSTPQSSNALSWSTSGILLDTLGGWSSGQPTRYTPPVEGWFMLYGKVGFAGQSTGSVALRGGTYAVNGAAADGGRTVVVGASTGVQSNNFIVGMSGNAVALNGSSDFVELWAVQVAGETLATSTTDGGWPELVVVYAGPLP